MTSIPRSRPQLIIGLPRTGKTTFLAALWHVVASAEISTELRLEEVFGEDEHLNTIRRRWLCCEEFERTKLTSERMVTMRLSTPSRDELTDLVFPDLSGETFQQQWELRQWGREYVEFVREAIGALLFVHPDRVNRQVPLSEANIAVAELDGVVPNQEAMTTQPTGGSTEQPEKESESSSTVSEWQSKHTSTQTQLVELLQFIAYEDLQRVPFRVAVVISAWDKVRSLGFTPDQWLKTELPLLSQFLHANDATFSHRVYGVSAQGGDLQTDRSELANFVKHTERIELVGPDVSPHDLTAIVKWVME